MATVRTVCDLIRDLNRRLIGACRLFRFGAQVAVFHNDPVSKTLQPRRNRVGALLRWPTDHSEPTTWPPLHVFQDAAHKSNANAQR